MFLYLAVLLLWLIYKWLVKDLDYYEKLGVPHEKPLPVFGNTLEFLFRKQSPVVFLRKKLLKYKDAKIVGFMIFFEKSFFVTDAEVIRKITIKDFDHFANHSSTFLKSDQMLSRTIFAVQNQEWKNMRMTLGSIFTSSKLKMMFELMLHQSSDLVKFFEERTERGEKIVYDVCDLFSRYTADGIANVFIGIETDCVRNENSEVYKYFTKKLHDFLSLVQECKFMLFLLLPKVYQFLGLQVIDQEIKDYLYRAVIQTMNDRDRSNTFRPDIFQLMLQAKKDQLNGARKTSRIYTDEDWIAQGFAFGAAGFDTTENLLIHLYFELVKNPEIQKNLQDEIDDVAATLDDSQINYEALHQMKFLHMVISETLRKWPPSPFMDRECSKDYELDLENGKKLTIKKGQLVFLPFCTIHHDERYFPNPEKFDPYRFSDERKKEIVPGSFIPFGSGPRACIGGRFALMGVKLSVFNLLRKFNVIECANTPTTLTYEPTLNLKVKEKVFMQFVLRK